MPKTTKEALDDTAEAASLLAKAEIDRFKLKLTRIITTWVTRLIVSFILILMLVLFLIFLGMAMSFLLQAYMPPTAAFAVVGAIYAAVSGLVYAFRKPMIEKHVLQNVLNEIFDET